MPAVLKIVDILGRVLIVKQIESSNSILINAIAINALSNGVYSIILDNKEGHLVEKFIKN